MKTINPSSTSRGIGLTTDGVVINSYKGNVVEYGYITSLLLTTGGTGYKIPNNINESLPILLVNDIQYPNLLQIYSTNIIIDIAKIPDEFLTGFVYKPTITITRNINDVTGKNLEIDCIYRVDGTILEFDVINHGVNYTNIPTITISAGGKPDYIIPKEYITMTGVVGVKHVFTPTEITDELDPLSIKNIELPDSIVYEAPPVVDILYGTGATGVVNLIGDTISSVTINNPGANYSNPPRVVFYDESGILGTGNAIVQNSKIVSVSITNPGEHYSVNTRVGFETYGSSATFVVSLERWTINIVNSSINPHIDNIGGYVYNYSDTFVSVSNVPDTVNYPQYLVIKNIE